MNPEELESLRLLLIERRQALVKEGDLKAEPNRTDVQTLPDEDEQPLNEMNQVIASRRNRVRAEEIAGIDGALQRIQHDPDEFGICQDCEEPIAIGRLRLMPWALFCVKCQGRRGSQQRAARAGRRRHAGDFDD